MYKIVRTPSTDSLLIDMPCDLCGTWVPRVQLSRERRYPDIELCPRCVFRSQIKT